MGLARGLHFCFLALCAGEQRVIDEFALVQKSFESPSWQVVDPATGLVTPSQPRARQTQMAVNSAATRVSKRILDRFKGTRNEKNPLVQMLKWGMAGKLTEWVMGFYRIPKNPSEMVFADSVVSLFSNAFDRDSAQLSDKEVLSKLGDWAAIHRVVSQYSDAAGMLPEVTKVLDTVTTLLEERKPTNMREAGQVVAQAFDGLNDMPMVSMLKYAFDVSFGEAVFDIDKAASLIEGSLKEMGAPESALQLAQMFIDDKRKGTKFNFREAMIRMSYGLADVAQDLKLPPALSDFFTKMGVLGGSAAAPESVFVGMDDTMTALENLTRSIGMPEEVSQYAHDSFKCFWDYVIQGDMKEVEHDERQALICPMRALAKMSLAIGVPPAVSELLDFTADNFPYFNGTAEDGDVRLQRARLTVRALEQAGYPQQLTDWFTSVLDQAVSGELTSKPQVKYFTEALRFMGAPALSGFLDSMNKLIVEFQTSGGKKPNNEHILRAFLGLLDIPSDINRVNAIFRKVNRRLYGPIRLVVSKGILNATADMPDSFLKRSAVRTAQTML